MTTETSAGGVIVRKKQGTWEVLLICDRNGNWTFPKGHIEEGEHLIATALREIAEETGLRDLTFMAELLPVSYMYTREGPVKKSVHYFLFSTPGNEALNLQAEEGISDAQWIGIHEADAQLGYPKTNAPLLDQTRELLSQML